ncbi:polysaccharide lyase family 14 protein [Amanita rubescens]|nr:polysaccharide lyase family 14 protein [Amanita rubescens]
MEAVRNCAVLAPMFLSLFALTALAVAQQVPPASVASTYSLTTSTAFPYPSATQSTDDTQSFIVSQWSLSKGRIQNNPQNLAFIDDPFPNNPPPVTDSSNYTGPVLQVTYPQGSYSDGAGGTGGVGGAQFINLWNASDGSSFNSMLLSYEVAFDTNFNWVLGGKLPGLRGGLATSGCSGGSQSDGSSCFSSRVMWRQNAAGEVYAYIPTPNGLCNDNNIICNSDYGISISRGSFTFTTGQWNRITMLVLLNNPPDLANGNIQLYFNDVLAINQTNLQIRSNSSLAANGMYFSTFFGGSDSSYETPVTTYTYFRNLQLWGGSASSSLSGEPVTSGAVRRTPGLWLLLLLITLVYLI